MRRLAIALAMTACSGVPAPAAMNEALINGSTSVPSYEAERMVKITSTFQGRGFLCSGTLLTDDWVLTAAHCVYGQSPSAYTVVEYDNVNASGPFSVSEIHIDPYWSGVGAPVARGDLALMKIINPSSLFESGFAWRQPFYQGPDLALGSQSVHAFGFGVSDPFGFQDGRLRDAHLTLNGAEPDGYSVTPGANGTMWGGGDSGGGAFADVWDNAHQRNDLQMIGVHSSVADNNPNLGFDIDPRKSSNQQWIQQTTQNTITVLEAFYGYNCGGGVNQSWTQDLFNQCEGKTTCNYVVDYHRLGDPAPGCAKNYYAYYFCGLNQNAYSAYVPPEAGFGSIATLSCP